METTNRDTPIFSVNLFRFDRFNLHYLILAGALFATYLIPIIGMKEFFSRGRPLLALGLVPLFIATTIALFGVMLPGLLSRKIKVLPDKLREKFVLFKTLKNQSRVEIDHPYEYLRIYPTWAPVLSSCFAFKDIRFNSIRFVAPDIAVQIMNHIREVVGEEKWQQLFEEIRKRIPPDTKVIIK